MRTKWPVARAEYAEESLTTASRLFLALMKQDDGAKSLLLALPEVFPWVRHLDAEEVRAFTVGLLEALSDAAELDADDAVHRAIVSWRASARRSTATSRPGRGRGVSPKKGDRVSAPPLTGWHVVFGTTEAVTGWEELCRLALPNAHRCLDALRNAPLSRVNWG
ncbi:hypothetical protein ACL02R_08770 [Streptomyces sp. MS19]|uniref:hypothetical protein n=1 Tax=Streptomyces sp. MS19 TaxID=3385972 RepID=UPI0039A37A78